MSDFKTSVPLYNLDTLIQTAKSKKWCFLNGCTTCGYRDFGNEINEYLKKDRVQFLNSIYEYDFKAITNHKEYFKTINNYREFSRAIFLIEYHLRDTRIPYIILKKYIERPDLPIRLADYIFFYVIRYTRNESIRYMWTQKCIEFVCASNDVSLMETLLYSYNEKAKNISGLIELATEMSKRSSIIKELLIKFSLIA